MRIGHQNDSLASCDWLIDRLPDWLTACPPDRRPDWLPDWLTDWLPNRRLTDWLIEIHFFNWFAKVFCWTLMCRLLDIVTVCLLHLNYTGVHLLMFLGKLIKCCFWYGVLVIKMLLIKVKMFIQSAVIWISLYGWSNQVIWGRYKSFVNNINIFNHKITRNKLKQARKTMFDIWTNLIVCTHAELQSYCTCIVWWHLDVVN